MDILITGGTVFASRYTAEYFAKAGHNVFVLNRGTRPQSEGVTHLCGDRHDAAHLLKNRHFDAVIDVTAYCGEDITGLLDSLGDFGAYVMISSSAVYPETLPQPFSEDAPCGPNSIWGDYGTRKLDAENTLLERVPDAYILRPPYLYGPMNNVFREAFVFECAEQGLPFYVPQSGGMTLQFFHIRDLCRTVEVILEKRPQQHILNVGDPVSVTVNDWVKLCYGVLGKVPEIRYVPGSVPQRSYFPFYDYDYRLDVSALQSLLPELTPLDKGLAESWEWFRENRELVVRKPLHEYISENFGGNQ